MRLLPSVNEQFFDTGKHRVIILLWLLLEGLDEDKIGYLYKRSMNRYFVPN